MIEIRLSERFAAQVQRIPFDEAGGAAVNLVFADGTRLPGRLLGDGLTFWTAATIPASEIVEIDEFVA